MIYQDAPGKHEIGTKFLCPNCRQFRYEFGILPEDVQNYTHKFIAYCSLEEYTVHKSSPSRSAVTGRFMLPSPVDGLDGAV